MFSDALGVGVFHHPVSSLQTQSQWARRTPASGSQPSAAFRSRLESGQAALILTASGTASASADAARISNTHTGRLPGLGVPSISETPQELPRKLPAGGHLSVRIQVRGLWLICRRRIQGGGKTDLRKSISPELFSFHPDRRYRGSNSPTIRSVATSPLLPSQEKGGSVFVREVHDRNHERRTVSLPIHRLW